MFLFFILACTPDVPTIVNASESCTTTCGPWGVESISVGSFGDVMSGTPEQNNGAYSCRCRLTPKIEIPVPPATPVLAEAPVEAPL